MTRLPVNELSFDQLASPASILVQDGNEKERTDKRATSQPLFDQIEKYPFTRMDSVFVEFPHTDGYGYSGTNLCHVSSRPTMVKKIPIGDKFKNYGLVRRTSHPNLVNLMDMSLTEDEIFLSYEATGTSLTELRPLLKADVTAVASICKKIIHGLTYIHEVLNISHGDLNCDNVFVNDDGEVQIGDIGKSMLQINNTVDHSHDVEAVYDIVATLLDLSSTSNIPSLSGLIANEFTKMPTRSSVQDLLKHPFFRISQDSWFLSHLRILHSFYLQTHTQVEIPQLMEPSGDVNASEERRQA